MGVAHAREAGENDDEEEVVLLARAVRAVLGQDGVASKERSE